MAKSATDAAFLSLIVMMFVTTVFSSVANAQDCGEDGHNARCLGDNCCSQSSWCGISDGHCGDGCQAGFGKCSSSGGGSGVPGPDPSISFFELDDERYSPPEPIMKNLTHDDSYYNTPNCGSQAGGKECEDTKYCCSHFGFCGETDKYCGKMCQSGPCTGGGGGQNPKTPSPSN